MKLIIDISDEQYEIIKKLVKNQNSVCPEADSTEKIILNGTLLPKGHGRLIDASNLLTVTDYDGENEKTYVSYDEIENALTIIEADKENEK